MYDESKIALSTSKKLGSSITKSRFWTFLTVLTAENGVQLDFLSLLYKIDHYCRGFERKMRRVGLILTKLSFDEDFKGWTF